MTAFNFDLNTEQPDCVFVEVDCRFNVAIIRRKTGLDLCIYPRTNGKLWDAPFEIFEVKEAEIIALEAEMEE